MASRSPTREMVLVLIVAAVLGACAPAARMTPSIPPGSARPAIEAVLSAFEKHRIVGIAELHRNAEQAAFIQGLLRDPRFAAEVGTVVVEVSPTMASVLNSFVKGEVDERALTTALRNGTFSIGTTDSPAYAGLYTTIRDVNAQLDAGHQIEIVAADAPLDWSDVTDAQAFLSANREGWMAWTIEKEVYAKDRKALWLVGGAHLGRMSFGDVQLDPSATPPPGDSPATARGILEAAHPGSLWLVGIYAGSGVDTASVEAAMRPWTLPAVVDDPAWVERLTTSAGGDVLDGGVPPPGSDGQPLPSDLGAPPSAASDSPTFDAVLVVATCEELHDALPPAALYDDPTYRAELDRRSTLLSGEPFDPTPALRQTAHQCG